MVLDGDEESSGSYSNDSETPSGNGDRLGPSREEREELWKKITTPNSTKATRFALKTDEGSFTLYHYLGRRPVTHQIPWQSCTPDPKLVQTMFTKSEAKTTLPMYRYMRMFEEHAKRPLKDDEMAALAYHASKKAADVQWYSAGAFLLGSFLWFRSRKTFKLPWWRRPKDPSAFDVFPFKRLPLLRGYPARWAWYLQRYTLYLAVVYPLGLAIGNVVTSGNLVASLKEDDRISEVVEVATKALVERNRGLRRPLVSASVESGAGRQTQRNNPPEGSWNPASSDQLDEGQAPAHERNPSPMSHSQNRQSSFQGDGAAHPPDEFGGENTRDPYSSPYPRDFGGSNDRDRFASDWSRSSDIFDWDITTSSTENESDPSLTSSTDSGAGSAWDRLRQDSARQTRNAQQSQTRPDQQPRSPAYPWNPPAPSSPPSSQPPPPYPGRPQQQQTQGPSKWESIRSGQTPVSSQLPVSSATDDNSPTSGDGYSFSSSNEDKSSEKDEAQKKFDQMLEKERKGESEGGGGGWWGS